jgi:glycosyltransferase involved in cell wall biosynthesis
VRSGPSADRRSFRPRLIDLGSLGSNVKGVARVLTSLTPALVALDPDGYRVVCTAAGREVVDGLELGVTPYVVRPVPDTVWEQAALPAVAARLGVGAVYSHRECGALWGPRLVLHVPEDPEVRWQREPVTDARDRTRRRYSRLLMDRSLRRSTVVTSTAATAGDLARNHHLGVERTTVVPLGVDLVRFHPSSAGPAGRPYFFNLASSDDRDRTTLVVRAFARYRADRPDGADLVIGGRLGPRTAELHRLIDQVGMTGLVTLLGEVTDRELAGRNATALATVHASPDEGFGLQPLEAMACGSLLIATPSLAVEEVAGDGLVVWAEPTIEGLADGLRTAEDRPEMVAQAGTVNRRRAEQFTWERSARQIHRLLQGDGGGESGATPGAR